MKFNKIELKRGKMTYLRQKKKEQKPILLDGLDYSILSYEQLLEVNGAIGSCSGGSAGAGSSCGGGGYSSSSSSSSGAGSSISSSSNCSGGGSYYVGGTSSSSSCGGSGYSSSSGSSSCSGSSISSSSNCSGGGSYYVGGTSSSSSCGGSGYSSSSSSSSGAGSSISSSSSCSGGGITATDRIEAAITRIGEKKYVVGSYQCDEYVADVLSKSGYNPKDYYVDNPHGKNIDTHIKELTKSGKSYEKDASNLQKGTYVVFMHDIEGVKNSHAALLVVESESSAYIMDNSSHNNPIYVKNSAGEEIKIGYKGGTEKTAGGNASKICSWYTGYDNFYFQKIGDKVL